MPCDNARRFTAQQTLLSSSTIAISGLLQFFMCMLAERKRLSSVASPSVMVADKRRYSGVPDPS
jgi:hypothetical protein